MSEAPDHQVVKQLITQWVELSRESSDRQFDILFRFVALWIAFNALYEYYAQETQGNGGADDMSKIQNYIAKKKLEERHGEFMRSSRAYSDAVSVLAEKGIIDLSSGRRSQITRPDKIEQVLRYIYRIRCNLFHGGKTPTNPRDNRLIHNAYEILLNLVEPESKEF